MDVAPTAPAAAEFARVEHSEQMLKAIRTRVEELNISHETLDHLAGLQSGYAGKILCNPPIKRMGAFTLFLVLQALGLSVVLVENTDLLKALKSRLIARKKPRFHALLRTVQWTPDAMRLRGRLGGLARAIADP